MSLVLSLFFGGLLVYVVFIKNPKNLGKWERSFIEVYLEKEPDNILKLQFDNVNENLMYELCKTIAWGRELRKYPPELQTNQVDFKEEEYPSPSVEMIRCNEKYAIVAAPGKNCAFVLKKFRRKTRLGNFFINKKFCLKFVRTSKLPAEKETTNVVVFRTSDDAAKENRWQLDEAFHENERYEHGEPQIEAPFDSAEYLYERRSNEQQNFSRGSRSKRKEILLTEYESDDEDDFVHQIKSHPPQVYEKDYYLHQNQD